MSYESRIFVVDRSEIDICTPPYIYGEKIADIKMGCMYGAPDEDEGFLDLFQYEIDYTLFIDNGDEDTKTDKYGEVTRYADCKTVIEWLEKAMANGDTYRRLPLLLGLLKGINEDDWHDIQVVHYGY